MFMCAIEWNDSIENDIKENRSKKKSIKFYIFCCNRTVVNELSICMLSRSQSIRNTCISLMSSYVNLNVWTFNWYVRGPRYELIAPAVTVAAFVHSWNVKVRRNENIEKWPFLFLFESFGALTQGTLSPDTNVYNDRLCVCVRVC